MQASGTFEVKLTPQAPASDAPPDPTRSRLAIHKHFHGGLEAESRGEMLTGGDPAKGSAGYVAIECVTGALDGRRGSFLLQHSGTMHAGKAWSTVSVIPGSGTEQLEGISGSMAIEISAGQHSYKLEYDLPSLSGLLLAGLAGIVDCPVHCLVIVLRLQVGDHFGRLPQRLRQALLQQRGQAMRLGHGLGTGEQQMHLHQQPMPGAAEPHTVILNAQFRAQRVQLLAQQACRSADRPVSSSPVADRQIRLPPDHRIFTATASAQIASQGFHPVHITSASPATTPALVQLSVRTCFPSASRISDCVRFPVRTRYQPSPALRNAISSVNSVPAPTLVSSSPLSHFRMVTTMMNKAASTIMAPSNPGGKEADPFEAVKVALVGRLQAQPQAEPGEYHGHQMNDGFRGVGEDSRRPGDQVGGHLAEQHQHADNASDRRMARRISRAVLGSRPPFETFPSDSNISDRLILSEFGTSDMLMRLESKPVRPWQRRSAAWLVLLAASLPLFAQTKLLRFPDIHDNRIVFTYGGDLWTGTAAGGTATRLTAHPGRGIVRQVLARRQVDRLHRPVRRRRAGLRHARRRAASRSS